MTRTDVVTSPADWKTGSDPAIAPKPNVRATSEYRQDPFKGASFLVPNVVPPPGPKAWELVLLKEGYEEQADEASDFSELAIPAAVQAMDLDYPS
jgi:hypothetical protein